MTQKEADTLKQLVALHPAFSREQETVDEVITFFYQLLRDQPDLLARADAALQARYSFKHHP